jgi:hypothetical protein
MYRPFQQTTAEQEIGLLREAYFTEFRMNLEADILSEAGGDFSRLMVLLLNAERDEENEPTDQKLAEQDAAKLHAVG